MVHITEESILPYHLPQVPLLAQHFHSTTVTGSTPQILSWANPQSLMFLQFLPCIMALLGLRLTHRLVVVVIIVIMAIQLVTPQQVP